MLRPENILVFQQRRVQRVLDGLGNTVFPLAITRRDDGRAAVAQSGVNVVEVKVHIAVAGDKFRNRAGGIAQCVVSLAESIEPVEVRINLGQLLVVDNQKCIHILAHFFSSFQRLENLLFPLEEEWDSDDAYGQQPFLLGDARNHRSGAGAGAAPHTCCDENHLGLIVEQAGYFVGTLFGSQARLFGVVPRSESACHCRAYKQPVRHNRVVERLPVGVTHHKRHLFDALLIHVVHCVVAAAANTDNLDYNIIVLLVHEV